METGFIVPVFVAGILTFLAPCTLPLVPGYLGFISGVSLDNLKGMDTAKRTRLKILLNGFLYVLGFGVVFVLMGSLFALGGTLLSSYRFVLARIGGVFVIIFGLSMTGVFRFSFLRFLETERHFSLIKYLKPGNPASSFLFGATFAFGWTPCIGPVLGSALTLAATSGTVFEGSFLLTIFALGLAVPFLIIAIGIGSASRHLERLTPYLGAVSVVGGIFLVILGALLATNHFGLWVSSAYQIFRFINYDSLLNYL